MWDDCGMARNAAGLQQALADDPGPARGVLAATSGSPGGAEQLNQELEKAGRVADFFELAELMCRDALDRDESCGGHFREEHQTPEGEALRDDDELLLRRGLGVERGRQGAGAAQGAARLRVREAGARGATSNESHPPRLAPDRAPTTPGRMERYEVKGVNEHMSFLEMLDVLNEQLVERGRGADRLRPRLPRGDLRLLRLHDQRRGARAAAGTTVCQLHMRHFKDGDALHARALARAGPSRWSRTWWSTAAPSTASSRPAATSRSPPAARRRRT